MVDVLYDDGESIVSLVQHWHLRKTAAVEAALTLTASATRDTDIPIGKSRLVTPGSISSPTGEVRVLPPNVLIQASIIVLGDKTNEGQLVEGVAISWYAILRELEHDPDFLFKIPWRKLEELVAGAYERDPFYDEVILTPRSGDRGRDVIATKHGFGSIRIYDQVKAYKPGHKVPADDVRALLGVLDRDKNVSKGVITTTGPFAPGAEREMKEYIPHRLELKDRKATHEWLVGILNRRPPAS